MRRTILITVLALAFSSPVYAGDIQNPVIPPRPTAIQGDIQNPVKGEIPNDATSPTITEVLITLFAALVA